MMNLTPSELRQMLAQIDLRSPFGARDHLLLVLDFNTGLRVSELAALTVASVSHNGDPRQTLHVLPSTAKGRKSRLVPLNSLAQKAIRKLLAFNRARGFSTSPEAPLFVTRNHTPMSVRSIQALVADLREKAGLDFQATPHSLRHGFASEIAQHTGNLRVVQKLLGHRRLNTVECYTHPRRDEMAQAVETLVRQA